MRTLNSDAVLDAAEKIAEAGGFEMLNMNTLAAALEVKLPSLYNHVRSVADLRWKLAERILSRVGETVEKTAVGRSGETALREVAFAYRRFAREHPQSYRVFVNAPTLNDSIALESIRDTLRRILSVFGLPKDTETHFIRQFHAALHGFVALENAGFFNGDADVDESFAALVDYQMEVIKFLKGCMK